MKNQYQNPTIVNLDEDAYYLHSLFADFQNLFSLNCNSNLNELNLDEIKFSKEFKYNEVFRNTLTGQLAPVCSILGSYAAQEVIKSITHKYTPTNQWFYYHCFDILPENFEPSIDLKNDRYDGMRKIFGNDLVDKIRSQSYFIVGSGAIGCEHLKNFVMMGIGSLNSKIVITDMDIPSKNQI